MGPRKQSVQYARLYTHRECLLNLSRDQKLEWVPTQPQDFQRLFAHPINEVLMRLEEYKGVWKDASWTGLRRFSGLLELVPNELTYALNRTVLFWDEIASLCDSETHVLYDETTARRVAGLWPAWSMNDLDNLSVMMENETIFPFVEERQVRMKILRRIMTLEYRVPTLKIVIAEAKMLEDMTTLLSRGKNITLNKSCISVNGLSIRKADKSQYNSCFLAAARACGHKDPRRLSDEVMKILCGEPQVNAAKPPLGPETGKRIVSAPPNGIWKCSSPFKIEEYFWLENTGSWDGKTDPKELPMTLLVKDFFQSFFGSAKDNIVSDTVPSVFEIAETKCETGLVSKDKASN